MKGLVDFIKQFCGFLLRKTVTWLRKIGVMGTYILGKNISLEEIKLNVRDKISLEFIAESASELNLDDKIKEYIKNHGQILLPKLNTDDEIFDALWHLETPTKFDKWNYIVLLIFYKKGRISYKQFINNNSITDKYLVSIRFLTSKFCFNI